MFFENKQKKVESQITQYCDSVINCLDEFRNTFTEYCKSSDRAQLASDYTRVHKAESIADDIRREIEVMMYTKALFPESRGDILGLLETMDKVPNEAESAVRMILNQHIEIPEQFRPDILQLVDICHRCVSAMIESVNKLFSEFTNATVAIGKIDELESEADFIEENLIENIFASNIEGWRKLLLRDLVKRIAGVSDRAENVGDRVRIIVAKRRI